MIKVNMGPLSFVFIYLRCVQAAGAPCDPEDVTFMSDIPRALAETQPTISSHRLRMNWCGTTNTSRSAPFAASRSSGTATWEGKQNKTASASGKFIRAGKEGWNPPPPRISHHIVGQFVSG